MYLAKGMIQLSRGEKVARIFKGHVLSKEESIAMYKDEAMKALIVGEVISKRIMREKVGFSCWNSLLKKWGACLKSENGIDFYYEI